MISKIYYSIVAFLIIATLVACELFESGYGNKVDLSEPAVTIDSPVNGQYVSGTFILKGTASDDTSIKEVKIEYISNVSGNVISKKASITDANWFIEIDTSDTDIFADGEIEFTVIAIDSADKQTSKSRMVFSDNTVPTVLVNSPSKLDLLLVNGILEIRGIASDKQLDKVEVSIVSSVDGRKIPGIVEGTNSWKSVIDTVNPYTYTDPDGVSKTITVLKKDLDNKLIPESFYIEIVATDKATNKSTSYYHNDDLSSVKSFFNGITPTIDDLANKSNYNLLASIQKNQINKVTLNVDQETDLPVLILDDWLITENNVFSSNVNLFGTVIDDDGIESVVLSIYNKNDNTLIRKGNASVSGSRSFSLNVKLEDVSWASNFVMDTDSLTTEFPEGSYYFILTAEDTLGSIGTTIAVDNKVFFTVDKTPPELSDILPLNNNSIKAESLTIDSVTSEYITVTGKAIDAGGIKEVRLFADGDTVGIPAILNSVDDTWVCNIPNNWVDEFKKIDISIIATDVRDKTDSEIISIYVDNKLPIINPALINLPDDVNGIIRISGKVDENQLLNIKYSINGSDYLDMPEANIDGSTWYLDLDTTVFYPLDGISEITIPFNIIATDRAGNASTGLTGLDASITIDQDSDKPKIDFKTPSSNGDSFSGTVTIWADITDDDDVIDAESIVLTITKPSGAPIIINDYVSDTGSLYTIKESNAFDEDGDYSVSLTVKDKTAVPVRTSTVTKTFKVDSNGPIVEIETLYDDVRQISDTFTISGTVSDTMGFTKTIVVKASFKDEGSIETYTFNVDQHLDSETVLDITTNQIEITEIDGITELVKDDLKGVLNWSVDISVAAIVDETSDTLTVSISALDDAGNSSGESTRNIIIDKEKPVITFDPAVYNGSDNLSTINGIVELTGEAADNNLDEIKIKVGTGTYTDVTSGLFVWKYNLDTTGVPLGTIPVYIKGIDKAGNETAEVEYSLNVDQDGDNPIITVDIIVDETMTTSGIISGTVNDDDGVLSGSIKLELYNTVPALVKTIVVDPADEDSLSNGKRIDWEIDLADNSISQGVYTFTVSASDDNSKKISTTTAKIITTNPQNLVVDNGAPKIVVTSGESLTDLNESNSNITITGTVEDGLSIKNLNIQFEKDGVLQGNGLSLVDTDTDGIGETTASDVTLTTVTANKKYEWERTIDITDGDGEYLVSIIVSDPSKTTTETIRVLVDTTAPELAVTLPVDNQSTNNSSFEIKGTSWDTGVGLDGTDDVEYNLDGAGWITLPSLSGTSWSIDITLDSDLSSPITYEEGSFSFQFRSTDKLGNQTLPTIVRTLFFDKSLPTITALGTTDTQFSNAGTVSLSGTLTDSNAVAAAAGVTISVTKDGFAVAAPTITSYIVAGDNKSATWSATPTIDTDGLYIFTISGNDIAGKTHVIQRTVRRDTVIPVVVPEVLSGWKSGDFTLSGTSTDAGGSSLDNVEYRIVTFADVLIKDWSEVSGTASWSVTIDTYASAETLTGQGHKIEFRTYDKAANESIVVYRTLNFDKSDPRVTLISTGTPQIVGSEDQRKASFTISGIIDDDASFTGVPFRAASSMVFKINGTATTAGLTTDLSAGTWSYTQAANLDHSDDGLYEYELTVTDSAVKTASISKTFRVDTTVPEITITGPGAGESFLTSTANLSGSAVDLGVGVDSTTLKYNLNGAGFIDTNLTFSGTSWSIPNINIGATQGTKTLLVEGSDKLGNEFTTPEVTFYYDVAPPTITALGTTDTQFSKSGTVSLSGVLTDSNAVATAAGVTISVTRDGLAVAAPTITYIVSGDNKSATWSATPTIGTDGLYIFTITGNDIAGKTHVIQRTVRRDTQIPVVIPEVISGWKSGDFTLSGTSTDAGGSSLDNVEYRIVTFANAELLGWTSVSGTAAWSVTIDTSVLAETLTGQGHKIEFRTFDKATNESVVVSRSLNFDKSDPRVTLISTGTPQIVGSEDQRKASFTISGIIDDDASFTGVPFRVASSMVFKINGTATTAGLTKDLSAGTWSYTQAANLDHSDDGFYEYELTVTDSAAKTSSISKTFRVDTTVPEITITGPGAGESFLTSTANLSGSAVDLGVGVDSTTLKYNLNGAGFIDTNLTFSGTSWSIPNVNIGAIQGTKTLLLEGSDKLGNEFTTPEVTFYYDVAPPTITALGTTDTQFSKTGTISLSGTLTDSNAVATAAGITISVTRDGIAVVAPTITSYIVAGDNKSATWSATPTIDTDSLYIFTISGNDIAGKTHVIQRTVRRDTQIPVVIPDVLSGWKSGDFTMSGTSTDTGGSNLDKVEYRIVTFADALIKDWSEVSGTGSWSVTIDTSASAETLAGQGHKIEFRTYDKATNESIVVSRTLNFDKSEPRVTLISTGTPQIVGSEDQRKASFTISGIIDDDASFTGTPFRAASSMVFKINGTATTAGLTADLSAGTWSYTQAAIDGLYEYELTVTDSATKTSSISKTFRVDTTVPEITISGPGAGESFLTSTANLSGSAVDLGVGVDSTTLKYNLNGAGFVDTNLTFSGTSWSIPNANIGATQGTKTLLVVGSDKLGNEFTTPELTFYYDVALPTITALGTTDTQFSKAGTVSFSGTLTDSNAVAAAAGVTISVIKDGAPVLVSTDPDVPYSPTVSYTVAGDNKSATWSATPTIDTDGLYIFTISGKDIAGKTHVIQRTVRRDTVMPETLNISTNLTGWRTSTTVTVDGTANDTGSGIEKIEYSVNSEPFNLLSGTSSWNGTVNVPNGSTNDLRVRATDKAGNENIFTESNIKIDTTLPEIDLVIPDTATTKKVNGSLDLDIEVTATDLSSSGVSTVFVKAGDSDFVSGAIELTLDTTTYKGTIPAATISGLTVALSSGQKSIYARVLDTAGNEQVINFPLYIDKQLPTLNITSHSDTDVINKTLNIFGNASDTQGLASVSVLVSEDDTNWTSLTVSGDTTWSTELNTVTQLTADYSGDITVKVIAIDEAGNPYEETISLTVDQDTDKPIVKLNNIDLSVSTSVLKLSRVIYGTVTDDDGEVISLKLSVDNSTWELVTVTGGSWSYTIPGSQEDGAVNLYFEVVDSVSETFTTGINPSPRIFKQAGPVYQETMAIFTLDTTPPTIGSDYISIDKGVLDFSTKEDFDSNMPIGGSNNTIRIRTLALDATDIASVNVTIEDYAPVITASNTGSETHVLEYEVWDTGDIILSSGNISDGIKTVTIIVTDKSGLESTMTRGIRVDNTSPTLTNQGPSTMEQLTGNVDIIGLAGDSGSGLSTVEYKIGYNHGIKAWTPISGDNSAWTIQLTNADKISNYAGKLVVAISGDLLTITAHGFSVNDQIWLAGTTLPTGLVGGVPYYVKTVSIDTITLSATSGGASITPSTDGDNVRVSNYSKPQTVTGQLWDLPILFKVTDVAGNIKETTETDYILQVDPTGDIPKITIVYPDPVSTERTLGGSIRIFGSAQDNISVDKVYMQVTENTLDWDYTASNGTNWYNGSVGVEVDGSVSWNYTINTDGEFDPIDLTPEDFTDNITRPIYFRVRTTDTDGNSSPWTEPQKILVDKGVPLIGSTSPLTLVKREGDLAGGAIIASMPYTADIFLKGIWFLTGSVEDESGITEISIEDDINGTLGLNPTWFVQGASVESNYNYSLNIPVSNGSSIGRSDFKIIANDGSTPQMTTTYVASVQFDNTAPVSGVYSGNTSIVQSNNAYTLSSYVDEAGSGYDHVAFYFTRNNPHGLDKLYMPMSENIWTDTGSVALTDGIYYSDYSGATRTDVRSLTLAGLSSNPYVRVGSFVRIDGIDRLITAVNVDTISWDEEVDDTITDFKIAHAMIIDHMTIETPKTWDDDGNATLIEPDDGDLMVETVERSGGRYNWTASINSKNIPDGPVTIHWVSFDKAGNFEPNSIAASIANNRPRIANVILGTDLAGTDDAATTVKSPTYSALDGDGEAQSVVTLSSSAFTAVGLTTVDIEVVGGNGIIDYTLSSDGGSTFIDMVSPGTPTDSLFEFRSSEGADENQIVLSTDVLTRITEGSKNLIFTLWDSTEETIRGTTSLNAVLTVPLIVKQTDTVAPEVSITGVTLYDDPDADDVPKDNGHIDLSATLDLVVFDQANGVMDADDKVSGKVSISGTAFDDQRITSIWMHIKDFTFTGSTDIITQPGYSKVATYNAGVWTTEGDFDADGWKFNVSQVSIDQDGHDISWSLDWNTVKLGSIADVDIVTDILIRDRSIALNASTTKRVDVVPYITKISTAISSTAGDNFARSASGKYSVYIGETIDVYGFNFKGSSTSLNVGVISLGTPVVGSGYISVDIGPTVVSSDLVATVNSTGSLNNLNRNPIFDVDGQTILNYEDNSQANSTNNYRLTDDVSFYVWEIGNFLNSTNITDPVMKMDSASNYYMSYGDGVPQMSVNKNGAVTRIDYSYNKFKNTNVGYDSSGNIYAVGTNTDRISNNGAKFSFYSRAVAKGTNDWSRYEDSWTGKKLLETVYNTTTGVYDIERVQRPKLVVTGTTAATKVYMSYFDANHTKNPVKFRYGTINSANTMTSGIGSNINGTTEGYTNNTTNTGSAANYHIVAGSDMTYKGGAYTAVGVTSTGVAVVAWYDASEKRLMYSYNTTPQTPVVGGVWQTNALVLDSSYAGWYVDMTVGADNSIHIAYYNSAKGDLKYAYIPLYNSPIGDVTTVTVDSYLSVGSQITLATRTETVNSTSREVPYLTYFVPSFTQTPAAVRVAWRTDWDTLRDGATDDKYTEAWETITIPTDNVPSDGLVSSGLPLTGTYGGGVVLGYMSDKWYEKAILK